MDDPSRHQDLLDALSVQETSEISLCRDHTCVVMNVQKQRERIQVEAPWYTWRRRSWVVRMRAGSIHQFSTVCNRSDVMGKVFTAVPQYILARLLARSNAPVQQIHYIGMRMHNYVSH